MKRKFSDRILSFLLSFAMVFTSVPLPSFAETTITTDESNSNDIPSYYLFIDRQIESGVIIDTDEEKEYTDIYEETDDELNETENLIPFYKASLYEAGTEVNLVVKAEEGYEVTNALVEKIEAGENEDFSVEYMYNEETGILTFIMPEANVLASASFAVKDALLDESSSELKNLEKCADDRHLYEDNVVPATCDSSGYTVHICAICKDTYTDSEIKAIGHNYSEEVTKKATSTEEGKKTFTCVNCGDVYTEVIPVIKGENDKILMTNPSPQVPVVTDDMGETLIADVYIRELSTQLFYGVESTEDGNIWNADNHEKGHRFSFRINYAISGVDVAPVNSIRFTIPKSILLDRDGLRGDYYEMSVPAKMEIDAYMNGNGESIDSDVNWGYFEEGENIIIYNFRELEAGNNGYIELSYFTNQSTFNYEDMYESNEFTCQMTVPKESKEADPITVKINTNASISYVDKRYPIKYDEWQSSWGTEAQPANPTNYHYLVWTIESYIDATQPYNFTLEDNITGNFEGMEVVGYKFSGQSTFSKSNTVENQTQRKTRYDYVITSIPLETFGDENYWEANNTIVAVVDPFDQLDEDTQKDSSRQWTWTKPDFEEPSGHVNVYKRADGAYRAHEGNYFYGTVHRASSLDFTASEYSRYDMESFNGYNDVEITSTELDGFKYASWIVGYPYPWTYDSSYNDIQNPEAYGKLPVKYELIDEGIYLTNETKNEAEFSDLLTSEDFRFTSLGYSWYMTDAVLDEASQSFKETTVTYAENDIITFYGKFDNSDEWVQFASYNLYTKGIVSDATYVESMTENNILFKSNVNLVAYKLITENAHYYTELFTVPHLTLKNSQTVMDYITGKPAIGIHNDNRGYFYYMTKVGNEAPEMNSILTTVNTGDATVTINKQDAQGNLLSGAILQILDASDTSIIYAEWTSGSEPYSIALDANKTYVLHEVFASGGYAIAEDVTFAATDDETITMTSELVEPTYTYSIFAEIEKEDTEYARISQRYSELDKSVVSVSNNVKKRTYTISWMVEQSEEMEWGEGGDRSYIPQNGGTFYDLLPEGAVFDRKSVDVQVTHDEFLPSSTYTVKTIDNYKDTGRTMLIIDIHVSANHYNVYYNTVHSWNSLADYGREAYNPVAYETGNNTITNGFPDNGGQHYVDGTINPNAIRDVDLMTDLNPDLSNDTGKKFVYAEKIWDITAITAASSGLMKKVKAENDNNYTYETTTTINGNYSYQLRYMNSYTSASKNMIFFDSLENYDYDTMRNYGTLSDWRGELQSIDVNQLKNAGIAPVIYYSTISKLDIEENYDITDNSVWAVLTDETDLSTVKSIAIDMTKATDGSDFVLDAGKSVTATLYMKAPVTCPEITGEYAYTYNNIYIYDTVFDPTTADTEQDFLIHQDYTAVKLLVSGSFGINKVSAESEEIKIEGLEFRLMGTSAYSTEVDEIVTTDSNGQIYFEDVEMGSYILQEYKSTDDWLLDTTEYNVEIDNTGKVWIDGVEYTDTYITIKNSPRVHGNLDFFKKELGDDTTGVMGTTFRLEGTSDYGNDILMYITSASGGRVTIKNLELGTYKLMEVEANKNYKLNSIVYTVKVDNAGNVAIVDSDEKDVDGNPVPLEESEWFKKNNNGVDFIYNAYRFYEVELRKVDAINPTIFLEGAIFSLTGISDNGNKVDMITSSDRNGVIVFNGIEEGSYILQEIQAPKNLDENGNSGGNLNYSLDETEYIVVVDYQGNVTIDGIETEENTGYHIITNARAYDKEIVITKIWNDGLTSEERIAVGIIPKLHLTTRDLSVDETFHTHTWDAGDTLSNSTCAKNGEVLYTCTDCGMTNIRKSPVLEHTWDEGVVNEATCMVEGFTLYTCEVCGTTKSETIEILAHAWNTGKTTTEPTCTSTGEKIFTCTNTEIGCTATKTEAIDMLPHDYTGGGNCINCGAPPYLYSNVVMTGAGTVTVAVSTSDYDYYNSSQRPYYSKIITFAPSESGTYTFTAGSSTDSYGRLYDADMNSLTSNDDGSGNQFKISYTCTAGTVYYLATGFYSNQSSAKDIPVTIAKTS